MEGLCDTARRIRDFAEAFPEIKEDGQPLLDFMKAFRPGRHKEEHLEDAGSKIIFEKLGNTTCRTCPLVIQTNSMQHR
jgi:hypothetical protein